MSNYNALRLRTERRKAPFPFAEVIREDSEGNPVTDSDGNAIKDTIYLRRPRSGEFLRILEINKRMAEDESGDEVSPEIFAMMELLSELCVIKDDGADAGRVRTPGAPSGYEVFQLDDPLDLMVDYDLDISKLPEAMEHWGFGSRDGEGEAPKGKTKARKG